MNQQTGFTPILWSSCLAMLAVGANSTAIMAALPDMRTELSLSSAGVEWAVNAYLVVSAACIVLGGEAADRFGARLGDWHAANTLHRALRQRFDRNHRTVIAITIYVDLLSTATIGSTGRAAPFSMRKVEVRLVPQGKASNQDQRASA